MSIKINHQLQELIPHDTAGFSVTFYCDELAALPNYAGSLHWHPYFEIATAKSGVLDYQVGQNHIILEAGDSIFANSNMLHGIRQVSGDTPDPMPNIVFSGTVVAPETSAILMSFQNPKHHVYNSMLRYASRKCYRTFTGIMLKWSLLKI